MKTLSNVPIRSRTQRTTKQTLQILDFIHRFRHVTTRHVQLLLGHTSVTTTNNRLALLCAKGYIARHYNKADRASNQPASYYLTPEGLRLLQMRNPERSYRLRRSVKTDATMEAGSRAHYHTLADVYAHFKRHYDGYCTFSTTFDIAKLDVMPDEKPDGYIRFTLPDTPTQYYFIEVYGWGRSNYQQQRRIISYFQHADSERWSNGTGEPAPHLYVVAGGLSSQRRLNKELKKAFEYCYANNFRVFTTSAGRLDSEAATIWHEVLEYS